MSGIITELCYRPLASLSIPGFINRDDSARHLHLFDSTLARRNRQMGVRDANQRIYTDKFENVRKDCIWITNVLIEPYDLNSLVRKVLTVDADILPIPARFDNVWFSVNRIIYGAESELEAWRGHPFDVSRFHSVKWMTDGVKNFRVRNMLDDPRYRIREGICA